MAYLLFIAIAMLLGSTVRLLPALSATFPLGDGGLFYAMTGNLLDHHFALPHFTIYNSSRIPFAYPPLGFYAVAILHALTGFSILKCMQLFPAVIEVLSMGAFVLLAQALLPSRTAVLGATFAFALLPDTFLGEIRGGGVTRAPGQLFALLTVYAAVRLYRRLSLVDAAVVSVLGALTVMSHPEWTWFTAYSCGAMFLALCRSRRGLLLSFGSLVGVAALSAPWWVTVLARFGIVPFIAVIGGDSSAFPAYSGLFSLVHLVLTHETGFPVWEAAALVGVAICLHRRSWVLPGWLLLLMAVDARGPISRGIVIEALLAGVAIDAALGHFLFRGSSTGPSGARRRLLALGVGVLLARAMFFGLLTAESDPSLTLAERAGMSWVATHTGGRSTFLVITATGWEFDDVAEWFPVLAHRISAATVQGSEWLPGALPTRIRRNVMIQACALQSQKCLTAWETGTGEHVTYVWVAKTVAGGGGGDCCWPLRTSLDHDPSYARVFDNRAASIFRRR
jgi:hypothetical protein